MSLITKQIKRLREYADNRKGEIADICKEAADTIETLSEKVRVANMERSSAYYNGGWVPVSERLPEESDYVSCLPFYDGVVIWLTDKGIMGFGWYYNSTNNWADTNDCWSDKYGKVTAWMPLPKPY